MYRVALVAVLVAGCGVDFEGKYTGPLSRPPSPCSDGSTFPALSKNSTLTLTNGAGGEVNIESDTCPGIRGTQSGNTVIIEQVTCPPKVTDSVTITETYKGGTLALSGTALTVSLETQFQINASNGASGTCTGVLSGTLAKQP